MAALETPMQRASHALALVNFYFFLIVNFDLIFILTAVPTYQLLINIIIYLHTLVYYFFKINNINIIFIYIP